MSVSIRIHQFASSFQKTGKWNAMHVRIAWEIYTQQQKQKGDNKKDNPLVPSTSSTSSLAPPKAPSSITATGSAHAPAGAPGGVPPIPSLPPAKAEVPPPPAGSSAAIAAAAAVAAGQKRPASGNPQDFLHKRPATDADLLRSQLFHPPRPPNPLDPLSNHLLPRPPYMSPFGPSPLRKSSCYILNCFQTSFEI